MIYGGFLLLGLAENSIFRLSLWSDTVFVGSNPLSLWLGCLDSSPRYTNLVTVGHVLSRCMHSILSLSAVESWCPRNCQIHRDAGASCMALRPSLTSLPAVNGKAQGGTILARVLHDL